MNLGVPLIAFALFTIAVMGDGPFVTTLASTSVVAYKMVAKDRSTPANQRDAVWGPAIPGAFYYA